MARQLKVLINAQMPTGGLCGGVEQFLMGLVHALGRLTDGDEQYFLITSPDKSDWVKPLLGPNQTIVTAPQLRKGRSEGAKRFLGPLRRPAGELRRGIRRFFSGGLDGDALPQSDGFLDSLGGDVIHFPYQGFARCSIPSIYNPHDLQHLHYPQFFSKEAIAWREATYRCACQYSHAVAAPSWAVKSDLQQQYGLAAQKVFVIHQAPPVALYEQIPDGAARDLRERLKLHDLFALFPAQTWPHKNHLTLIEAIRLIRDRDGVKLNLVCTGRKNEHWPVIKRRIDDLRLRSQITFLDFVSPSNLSALYRLAQFVVFPSLFEGAGMPVLEAFLEGVAVTCSDIAPLREYGGDAVLTFDPRSTDSIAASLLQISTNERLREQLRTRGKEKVRLFTWERTGRAYRALYRKVAGVPLPDDDLHLLTETELSDISLCLCSGRERRGSWALQKGSGFQGES